MFTIKGLKLFRTSILGQPYSSVAQCLFVKHEALSSIPYSGGKRSYNIFRSNYFFILNPETTRSEEYLEVSSAMATGLRGWVTVSASLVCCWRVSLETSRGIMVATWGSLSSGQSVVSQWKSEVQKGRFAPGDRVAYQSHWVWSIASLLVLLHGTSSAPMK